MHFRLLVGGDAARSLILLNDVWFSRGQERISGSGTRNVGGWLWRGRSTREVSPPTHGRCCQCAATVFFFFMSFSAPVCPRCSPPHRLRPHQCPPRRQRQVPPAPPPHPTAAAVPIKRLLPCASGPPAPPDRRRTDWRKPRPKLPLRRIRNKIEWLGRPVAVQRVLSLGRADSCPWFCDSGSSHGRPPHLPRVATPSRLDRRALEAPRGPLFGRCGVGHPPPTRWRRRPVGGGRERPAPALADGDGARLGGSSGR